jgi:hypothetical protein
MTKIITTTSGKIQEHEITTQRFTILVHQQGIRVDVPEFVEINPRNTISCMEQMNQKEWDWISTGPLFKTLFYLAFDQEQTKHFGECKIPATIEELCNGDMGVMHVCGMIVLGCEAMMAGKSIFMRNPETYLHPATERMIVGMFHKMLELFGASGEIQTEVAEDPENLTEPQREKRDKIKKKHDELLKQQDSENPKDLVVRWLSCMDLNKKFAQSGNKIYTVAEMIIEVKNETNLGNDLVNQFLNNNFKVKKNA